MPLKQSSLLLSLFLVAIITICSSISHEWMEASGDLVIKNQQYYRLWTSLFAHADIEHLGSNLMLFFPFALYLTNYFSYWFFPILGLFLGGIINYLVILTMPQAVTLIGISGVVHWMGAAWITLYFFTDRRFKISTRLLKCTGVAAILFIPNTFSANISYTCHAIGFIAGIISGAIYYLFFKKSILSFEQYEEVSEPEEPAWEEDLEKDFDRNYQNS